MVVRAALPATVFVLLVASLLLGGGTRVGFAGDIITQAIAAIALGIVVWTRGVSNSEPVSDSEPDGTSTRLRRHVVLLTMLAALLAIVQLMPVPEALWSLTAFGHLAETGLEVAGLSSGWRALSLTSEHTTAILVSALVPLSVFLCLRHCAVHVQQKLCVVVVGIGFISLVLGFLQVAQGPDSSLRFFSFTNPSEAVGFFANRNHFAALLYTTLLFSAGLVLPTQTRRVMSDRTGSQIIFRSMMCFAGLIAVVSGLALARSRAGLGLGVLALAMIVATALWRQRARPLHDTGTARVLGRKAPYAMVILALVFAAQFGLQRMLVRFGQDPLDDLRVPLFTQTAQAIADALPWGSGLGSFVHVYAVQEQVEALFGGFANRAHNDVLEILLETGLMGFGLLLCFGVWFLARSIRIWHTDSEPSRQLQLQRAASLVLVLLALHSLVDYPLRTTALATLAAFAAAVMATPTLANTGTDTGTDRLGHNPQTQAQPLHVKPALDPAQLKPRWGKQVNWPKEWTTSDDDKPD